MAKPLNAGKGSTSEPPPMRQASPEMIQQFLDNQTGEIQVRNKELENQHEETKLHADYAKAALSVQANDRIHEREMHARAHRWNIVASGLCFLAFLIFVIILFSMGKDAAATEILKNVTLVGLSAGGGYGFGVYKTKKSKSKPSEEDNDPE